MSGAHAHALYLHDVTPVHVLPAHTKLVALLVFVLAVVATPGDAMWAFAVYTAAVAVGLATARVPLRFYLTRLAVIVPFVLFAVVLPFMGSGPEVDVLGVRLSIDGLWAAWSIIARALLGVSASVLLGATTPVPEILVGLRRLRVPATIIAIAGFLVRYLDVIAAELGRMRTAMRARGYRPRWVGDARPFLHATGALFVRSYERGERVHRAMVARGFRGTMPLPAANPAGVGTWFTALALSLIATITALAAMLS